METILTIIFALVAVAGCCLTYYFHIKSKIYAATENAVNEAEQVDKTAEEKMAIAVDNIYTIIPAILKPFFTKEAIQKIVQKAFDKIEEYAKKQVEKKKKDENS